MPTINSNYHNNLENLFLLSMLLNIMILSTYIYDTCSIEVL